MNGPPPPYDPYANQNPHIVYGQPGPPQPGPQEYAQPGPGYSAQQQQPRYSNQQYSQPDPQYMNQPQFSQQYASQQYQPPMPQEPMKPVSHPQRPPPNSTGDGEKFNYSDSAWPDVFWVALFVAHLVGILYLGFTYESKKSKTETVDQKSKIDDDVYYAIAACTAVSIVFSWIWLSILQRYSSSIIKFSFFVQIGLTVVAAFAMLANQAIFMGVIFLLMAGLTALYFYMVRNRIAFASALLDLSVTVVKAYTGTLFVTFIMQFLMVGWIVLWSFAARNAVDGASNEDSSSNFVVFLLLVSQYWTLYVIKNIVHVTVAGVAATWYFFAEPKSPTSGALTRSVTTSFGSICLGSLVVAIISALRAMANAAAREENDFVRCIVACILGCIENLVEYFNKYGYCYVAIYGTPYMESCKRTWNLFKTRGFDVIITDDLSEAPVLVGAIMGGAVGALVGYAITGGSVVGIVIGILLGVGILALVMSALSSCVATFIVLWAEDPAALQHSHPESFQKVQDAVRKQYPNFR